MVSPWKAPEHFHLPNDWSPNGEIGHIPKKNIYRDTPPTTPNIDLGQIKSFQRKSFTAHVCVDKHLGFYPLMAHREICSFIRLICTCEELIEKWTQFKLYVDTDFMFVWFNGKKNHSSIWYWLFLAMQISIFTHWTNVTRVGFWNTDSQSSVSASHNRFTDRKS